MEKLQILKQTLVNSSKICREQLEEFCKDINTNKYPSNVFEWADKQYLNSARITVNAQLIDIIDEALETKKVSSLSEEIIIDNLKDFINKEIMARSRYAVQKTSSQSTNISQAYVLQEWANAFDNLKYL